MKRGGEPTKRGSYFVNPDLYRKKDMKITSSVQEAGRLPLREKKRKERMYWFSLYAGEFTAVLISATSSGGKKYCKEGGKTAPILGEASRKKSGE